LIGNPSILAQLLSKKRDIHVPGARNYIIARGAEKGNFSKSAVKLRKKQVLISLWCPFGAPSAPVAKCQKLVASSSNSLTFFTPPERIAFSPNEQ